MATQICAAVLPPAALPATPVFDSRAVQSRPAATMALTRVNYIVPVGVRPLNELHLMQPHETNPDPVALVGLDTVAPDDDLTGPQSLACMEVWGGNEGIDSAVEVPGLLAYVYSRPYKGAKAGGDVHYVSSCGTGRITRIMIADVAGHGDKVADLARKLRDLMRQYINHLDQTKFVSALNREFSLASTAGRFATAIAATYWAETDFLVASNAGHPRPLWYRAKTKSWRILKDKPREEDGVTVSASNLPLGIDDVATYDQFAINLQPGDMVVFYSDSLTEAVNPEGEMLGESGLLGMIQQLDTRDPRRLGRQLTERIVAFCGGNSPEDDMTVMAMACTGRKAPATAASKFGAFVSFVKTLAGSWRKNAAPVPWPELSVVNILGPIIKPINRRWGGDMRQGEVRIGASVKTKS